MIRKLLLLLVVLTILQNTSYSQGAVVYGNAFWQNTNSRVVIRLALKNNTGSSGGQTRLMGWRFGFQYNASAVTFAGYTSYMTGLNDASNLTFIGADNAAGTANIDPVVGIQRTATISTGGTKVMEQRYINRSSSNCDNGIIIPSQATAILIDIYFTLNNNNPAYYHLNDPDYGFGDTEFIAQFLTKWNGGHNGDLTDAYKDIAIVIIRQGNETNPYQPFDASSCNLDDINTNPVTIGSDNINFITPINGVLAGKVEKLNVADRNDHIAIDWNTENNELVDHYEVERKDENGSFKTIGMIMSDNKASTTQFIFKDKITARDLKLFYRVKIVGTDQVVTYSDVKMIRPGSMALNTVKVFPNPTTDFIQFNVPVDNGNYLFRIYSSEGKLAITGNATSSNSRLNIRNLKAGSYFIELYHPVNGKRFYSQFSKQ